MITPGAGYRFWDSKPEEKMCLRWQELKLNRDLGVMQWGAPYVVGEGSVMKLRFK